MLTPSSVGSGWVLRPQPRTGSQLRLFCFPYAGGAASIYRAWVDALPPEVDLCPIQLPGRGSRFQEAPFRRAAELVPVAADALRSLFDMPFAFFGHSMGALLAFELARELRRRGWRAPVLLAVSGRRGPQVPDPDPPVAHLPDREFVQEMRARYDGIPGEVLADEELLRLVLPVLRADVLVLETHVYLEEPPLDCPISCFGGEEDRQVHLPDLEAWQAQTRGSFMLRTFPGSHFFLESARPMVLRALRQDLARWAGVGDGVRA